VNNKYLKYFKNISRFGPKVSFKINRFIPTKNHSISYFTGDNKNMVPFSTHVQQLTLGSLYCNFNSLNFYSKDHPYIKNFSIINNNLSSKFPFLKKRYRFFYFDRPESNFFKRSDFFSNSENDFPIKDNEKEKYISSFHDFNKNYLYHKLLIKNNIEIDRDTLVIHIRTGDIFHDGWHSMYNQNPLSFYLKISELFEKVLVISGPDENNPVLNILKNIDNKKFSFQSSNFIEDFNYLLNAKNLATSGVSGFPISAALMSQKLENFYHTNLYQTEHLNPEMIDKSQVNVHSYQVLDYIELGEFKDTVENNKKLIDQDTKKIIKIWLF